MIVIEGAPRLWLRVWVNALLRYRLLHYDLKLITQAGVLFGPGGEFSARRLLQRPDDWAAIGGKAKQLSHFGAYDLNWIIILLIRRW